MTALPELFEALTAREVEFIVVGGVAAVAHGSARLTQDVDIVYARTPENIARLVAALAPHEPYPRGAPPGLPFRWDTQTVQAGLNFTLTTWLGDIDVFGEIVGGGGYDELLSASERIEAFGGTWLCLGLERLIQVKRAAGRPRDFEAIAELEAIREARGGAR